MVSFCLFLMQDDVDDNASGSREAESPSKEAERKLNKKKKKQKKRKKEKRKRFKPQAIELASLLKTEDAEYDKWRAKIGHSLPSLRSIRIS